MIGYGASQYEYSYGANVAGRGAHGRVAAHLLRPRHVDSIGAETDSEAPAATAAIRPADLEPYASLADRIGLRVECEPNDDSHQLLASFKNLPDVGRDWNEAFQEVFARVVSTPADVELRVSDLKRVVTAFVSHTEVGPWALACHGHPNGQGVVAPQVVARVLVLQKQRGLPDSECWIKPFQTRGVAGGKKFVFGKVGSSECDTQP